MDQEREVFAVPGNITSKMSWGPNLLIKQGAKLVQEWNDVVSELAPEDRRRLLDLKRKRDGFQAEAGDETGDAGQPSLPLGPSAAVGRRVLEHLKPDSSTHIDELLERVEESSSSEIIAALFELEMLGLVRQLPGRNFMKVW